MRGRGGPRGLPAKGLWVGLFPDSCTLMPLHPTVPAASQGVRPTEGLPQGLPHLLLWGTQLRSGKRGGPCLLPSPDIRRVARGEDAETQGGARPCPRARGRKRVLQSRFPGTGQAVLILTPDETGGLQASASGEGCFQDRFVRFSVNALEHLRASAV